MFSDTQLKKIEALKEQFGLSNYEALQIFFEQEKVDALKSIALLMAGGNTVGVMNNFLQKDFSSIAENFSNILGAFIQKTFKNPQDFKKPSDRDDD